MKRKSLVLVLLSLLVFTLVGSGSITSATNTTSNHSSLILPQSFGKAVDEWIASPASLSHDALSDALYNSYGWTTSSTNQLAEIDERYAGSVNLTATTAEATPEATAVTPDQLENVYNQVWERINQTYYDADRLALVNFSEWKDKFVGKLTTIEELENALQQMVASIGDHWTQYIPYAELVNNHDQYVSGLLDLGMSLQLSNGVWKVWYVFYGGPAYYADIRRGDTITSIGGTALAGLNQEQVDALLLQQRGNKVPVVARHAGITESITLTVAEAAPDAVTSRLYPGNVAYIRFPNFDDADIYREFRYQLAALYQTSGPSHFRALLLDLRGNPGGQVQEAISFVALFLKNGVVMNETTRSGRLINSTALSVIEPQWGNATGTEFYKFLETVPMYVLVDETSASAAELTTGALKDNHRAVILGQTTWGKGVGYEVFNQQSGDHQILPTGGILQITTLGYTTPNGHVVQGDGVHPNVVIVQPRGHTTDVQLERSLRFIAGILASQ